MEILGRNYDKSSLSLGSKSDPEASSPLSCPQSSKPADGQQAASPGAVPSSYPAGALAPGQPPPGRHEAVPGPPPTGQARSSHAPGPGWSRLGKNHFFVNSEILGMQIWRKKNV